MKKKKKLLRPVASFHIFANFSLMSSSSEDNRILTLASFSVQSVAIC